jgi:hypothetical protein
MLKTTLKINPSLRKKFDALEQRAEDAVRDKLIDIAQTAVSASPVDTGAYVTSFSYTVGAGRPRGKSSTNKPTGQNPQAMRQEGFSNLMTDVNKLRDLLNTTSITLRNGSPHATAVEYKHGYHVFAKVRNIHG